MAAEQAADCLRSSLWYLDYYETPPHLNPPRMLDLPDEILLSIATSFSSNSDLLRLSLANRKLRHIAQEVLVKELALPKHGVRKFLETLCSRPDLGSKVTSVDLGDYGAGTSDKMFDLDTSNLFRKCRAMVDSINGTSHYDAIINSLFKDHGGIWTSNRRYFLEILIALSPNLRGITLRLPSVDVIMMPQSGLQTLVDPFRGPGSKLLQTRLRTLTITESTTWKSLTTLNITLRSFDQLNRLSIPLDALINPSTDAVPKSSLTTADLVQRLPQNLQHLQLRPCNSYLVYCLPQLVQACVSADYHYRRLQRLDLFFKSCLRSILVLIENAVGCLESFYENIGLLTRRNISVMTYDTSMTSSGDLLQELDARLHLSDSEAWLTAAKGEQYSATVSRTSGGFLARRSEDERRIFLRGQQASMKLRKACHFEPTVSFDRMPKLWFGKDKTPTNRNVKDALRADVWRELYCSYGTTTLATALRHRVSRSDILASSKDSQHLEQSSFMPEELSRAPGLCSVTSKFDAQAWKDVQFFSEMHFPLRHRNRGRIKSTKVSAAFVRRSSNSQPRRRLKQKRSASTPSMLLA